MTIPSTETALSQRQTLAELVAAYQRAERDIREGFRLIADAQRALGRAFGSDDRDTIPVIGRYHQRPDFDAADESLLAVNRTVWQRLVDRMQVKQMMSIEAAKELDRQLEHDELPPITVEAIETLVAGFRRQAPDMLQDAVNEVFGRLRPPGSKYKSNSEMEVPKRVVLSYMVERHYGGKLRVRWDRQQELIAMENVLHSLSGKGSVCRGHHSDLSNAIDESPVGETDLFRYRVFANGNLHLTFRDLDLLARFNQLAGGARLRKKGEAA